MFPSGGRQRASHHSALKRYECSGKDFYKAQAHRLAFDGDFRNNLMINFMAAMVRWQALSDFIGKNTAAHTCGCIQARKYTITSLCCAHHLTIARYLLFALVRYHDGAKNIESQTFIMPKKMRRPPALKRR